MTFFLSILFGCAALIFAALYLYQKYRATSLQNDLHGAVSSLQTSKETEKRLQEKVSLLAADLQHVSQDPVTYLPNWPLFEDRMNQSIKESARHQLILGLLLINIESFEAIDNIMGHDAGETILREVTRRLETCIRQVDSLSRMNKDTFAILLTKLSKPETAAIVAQRVIEAFDQPFAVAEQEIRLGVSIGIAIYPTDGQQLSILLNNAEQALRFAKTEGKDTFYFYRSQMSYDSQRELAFSVGLGRDTVLDELVLYYQPVMNTQKGNVFCMDACLYWHHPELGVIPSAELESQLGKLNKLERIMEYMLRTACTQFLRWKKLGFNPEYLAVSLTMKQLCNVHFIYQLSNILQEYEFQAECLILQIKSSTEALSSDLIEKAFNMLNYLGINISMDDYGAAAFPLWYLKSFPIKYLRLARHLISDVDSNQQTVMLVKSIMRLASDLSLQVIAQGVDSKAQHDALQQAGCVLMQGRFWNDLMTEKQVQDQLLSASPSS